MMKNGKRESSVWNAGVPSRGTPTQGLRPAVDGSVLTRSRILHGSEAVEFELTRGDSDDEPLVQPQLVPFPHGSTLDARGPIVNAVCEGWGCSQSHVATRRGMSSPESTSPFQLMGRFLFHRGEF